MELDLQAFYTMSQLVELTGVDRFTLGRELGTDGAGILKSRGPGKHRRVWLDDLKLRCPHLWRSILARAALAKAALGNTRT